VTHAAGGDSADTVIPEISGYREFSVLGVGATSTVWRAHQDDFDRWVAVKVLKPGHDAGSALELFEREKRTTAKLGGHPFIVQVFATGRTVQGRPFMAMDLCERGSIATRIDRLGTFSVDETIDIGAKIAGALQAAHDSGVLHRDIKPQNILLSQYGPALTDFGIARSSDAVDWTESLLQLTVNHAAPEIFIDTRPTAQADVYSLGSTLFTMLAGRPPFSLRTGESPMQFVVRLEREPLPPLRRPDVPDGLRSIIERSMAKRPEDRFGSAVEMEAALQHLQRGGTTTAVTPGPTPSATLGAPVLPRIAGSVVVSTETSPVVEPPVARVPESRVAPDPPLRLAATATSDPTVVRTRRGESTSPPSTAASPTADSTGWGFGWAVGGIFVLAALLVGAIVFFSTQSGGGADDPTTSSTLALTTVGAPTNVQAVPEDTIATLTWDDTSNGAATQYIVIPIDENNHRGTPQVVEKVTHATVPGLDPNLGYCFVVLAEIGTKRAVDDSLSHACIRGALLQS
jgi:serine/threonine protein kinase